MGLFFAYILKSSICLACFYLFYRWLLSKETFHRFNRIALLGILLLSLLIPFIEVTVKEQTDVNQTVLTIEQLLIMANLLENTSISAAQTEGITLTWIQIGLMIYLVGILFFTCRHLYSLCRMSLLLRSGKREEMDGKIILIVHDKNIAPFSWMKYIVISRKDIEENGREILIHERAHIQNRHSWDLLIADICIFFQWFNPGAWLLKQELQNIHEYEADETVINEGVNAKEYQLLLIKKAVGTRLYSMANSFNHSKLKKRITMMLKEKSNPWARLKYLYVLPLAAVAVAAFARPEVSETVKEISVAKVNDLAVIVATGIEENVVKVPADTVPKFVVVGTRGEVRDTVTSKGKVATTGVMKSVYTKEKALIIINGKESDSKVLNALDPACIESLSVLKPPSAVEVYGEKGKNGVILVQLYPEDKVIEGKSELKENVTARIGALLGERNVKDMGAGLKFGTTRDIKPGNEPLVFVDGKEVFGEQPLSKLSPERIRSISVLKDKTALETYGDKGKNGVIMVNLYTEEEYQYRKSHPHIESKE